MFDDVGISLVVIKYFVGILFIFGVCLGYQVIGQVFGVIVCGVYYICYGKFLLVLYNGSFLFNGIFECFIVICYYLLVLLLEQLFDCLQVIVWSQDGDELEIMVIVYCFLFIWGLQYYLEFLLIEYGYQVLVNFLILVGILVFYMLWFLME